MMDKGAIEEVQELNKLNLDSSLPIMKAHGVPEISNYLANKISLDDCINKGQQVTRNYVKRQLTWWRTSSLRFHQVFNEFPKEIDENLIKT
jgi:tRNA dimethylallyltransferase